MNHSLTNRPIDFRLKAPFTAVISGPTGCGKTQLLFRLISDSVNVCNKPPHEVIYCYGAWQEAFDNVSGVTFHEGMIDISTDIPNDNLHRWLIIDDLMSDDSSMKHINDIFTKGSHHRNISVFFVLQNLFYKNVRTISLNAQYFFLFKNPRDGMAVTNLAKQSFPSRIKFVRESFELATEKPYSHLMIDFRQETDSQLRLVSNFASSEMIVYVPKQ